MKLSKILCPVDFSDSSDNALQYATALAKEHGAALHLLHVLQPLTYGVGVDGLDVSVSADALVELRQACDTQMEKLQKTISDEGLSVTYEIITGTPFVEITRVAREMPADMIVLGTHGRTGLAHVLIGSVAERVVRKAHCPVLTVKHPQHDIPDAG